MESLVAWVAETIQILGYAGIVFLMMLESIILPLPSEIILPLAGFLVGQGVLNLWGVTLAATLGSVLGSMISYELGRIGGRPFLLTYGKYVWMRPEHLRKTDRWFRTHGEITILVARILPLTRYFISIPAGIARMDRRKFITYTAIGSFIWNLALIYGGVLLGQYWFTIIDYGAQLEVIIGSILILFLIWYGYSAVKRRSRFLQKLAQDNARAMRANVRRVRRHIVRAQRIGRANVERIVAFTRPRAPIAPPIVAGRSARRPRVRK